MTDAEFITLVSQMRFAQRAFFANRSGYELWRAKAMEVEIDKELKRRAVEASRKDSTQ